jgi:L-2-hydroxyglutarate oxidase
MAAPHLAVIGGGIVGLATALKLQAMRPALRITVLEKETDIGQHQSGHNSGVLHAGLAYQEGSAKSRLAVAGRREMADFCSLHDIPIDICGKLVVATSDSERPALNALLERGTRNGLRGLRVLAPSEMKEIEPHVGGVAALHVPEEGIVDFPRVCRVMRDSLLASGVSIETGAEVVGLRSESEGWRINCRNGEELAVDLVVSCGGLHADRIARLAGQSPEVRIVPFRGDYFRLVPEREYLVRHLIYPVADPRFPFLGVHFTRRFSGGIDAGPNAVLVLSREGYRGTPPNMRDALEIISFPGLWRFLRRYAGPATRELWRSLSRSRFCRSLARLVPDVTERDLEPAGSGVRAQAMRPDGTLVDDFLFVEAPRAVFVLNAPSPAATASLAIGNQVATLVLRRLDDI